MKGDGGGNRPEVIDPHCVPVTPADELVRVDHLPGGRVIYTMAKRQVTPEGETVLVVVARMEWSLAKAKSINMSARMVLDGGELAVMEAANVLPS